MAKLVSGTSVYGNITVGTFISVVGNIISSNANADIGSSVANSTYNFGAGVTGAGNTKNVNIGTGAAATSNTIITIGTTLGTGNVTFPANTTVIVANTGGLALSAVGNITGGNIRTAGLITATGNIDVGNVRTAGLITATGNIDVGNVRTAGLITATGNVTGGNILTGGLVSATANVIANNVMATTIVNVASHTGTVVSVTANVTGGNLLTGGLLSVTGTVAVANTGGLAISAAGNITGGNIRTAGVVSATGNCQFGDVTANSISATSNGAGTNFKVGDDAWIGDINLGNTIGIRGIASPTAGYIVFGNADGNALGRTSTGPLTYTGIFSASGNVNAGGNLISAGYVTATGNVDGGNLRTGGLITATGNVTGGNLTTAGLITATGNVIGGNLRTGGLISATGNITALSFYTGNTGTATTDLIFTQMADNDFFRIRVGGAANNGNVEFATADDGTEPIFFRQYTGTFVTVTRTLTLLDAAGDTTFPGKLFATSVYGTTVGATNRATYADNTGLIGYLASVRAAKTQIQDLNNVDWVHDLKPVSFFYRKKNTDGSYSQEADGGVQYGLVAEDVEPVNPELCYYDDQDGSQVLSGVNYNKLIPVLLKTVQDQKKLIDQLRQDLDQLRGL